MYTHTHMLTKRTNILFDELTWQALQEVSSARQVSVGQLVRDAVKKLYLLESPSQHRQNLLTEINRLNSTVDTHKINYQGLISHDRRF